MLLVGLFVDHGGDYGGAITIQKWGETSCTSGAAKQIVDSGRLVHPNLCTFYHTLGIDYIKPILFGHIIVPFQLLGDHSLGPAVWCMDIGLTLKEESHCVWKIVCKTKNAHAKRRTHARLEDYILVEMNGERRKASNKKCPQSSKGLRAVIPVLFAMTPAGGW